MNRTAVMTTLVLPLLLLGCLAVSNAQTSGEPRQEISPQKRALIRELLELTNSTQSADAMLNAQFDQMEKQMPDIVWQAISSTKEIERLPPEQRNVIRAKMNESTLSASKRMRELLTQRIDMKKLIEDISYPLHAKYFTESELKDLVAFYKSATGKKIVEVMPALLAESVTKSADLVMPKIQEIMREVQGEETKQLEREVEALLKSAPKSAPAKRRPSSRRPR